MTYLKAKALSIHCLIEIMVMMLNNLSYMTASEKRHISIDFQRALATKIWNLQEPWDASSTSWASGGFCKFDGLIARAI